MKNEQKIILKKLIDKFGIDNQIEQALEETIELALAMKKIMRENNFETKANLSDKLADVLISIEKLKLIFPDLDASIQYQIDLKFDILQYHALKN